LFHDALAELLPWLADNVTRLAGSPPPGVQPDNVEAQIQELQVNKSLLHVIMRVLHCVLLQWFIAEAIEKNYNYNCSTSYFSVLFCHPFLPPPPPPVFSHFSPLPIFFLSRVWSQVSSTTPWALPPWILLEKNSLTPVAQRILLKSKRTSKTWMTCTLFSKNLSNYS